jgi:hypothetical protein
MLRAVRLVIGLLTLSAGLLAAGEESSLRTNAALVYWQGFATMPKLSDAEESRIVNEFPTMPLDARAKELVARGEYSLRILHQAVAVRPCNWGINWLAEGPQTMLPQLSASRILTALAGLRARLAFESGSPRNAVDDLVASLHLARQCGLDGSMIGLLVDYSIENRTNDTLAAGLPALNADMLKALQTRLAALPPGAKPSFAMRNAEENTVIWLREKVKQSAKPDDLVKLFVDLFYGNDKDSTAKARSLLKDCGGTKEAVLKQVDDLRSAYAPLAQIIELDLKQTEVEANQLAAQHARNPLYALLMPSVNNCRLAQARTDVRRALLATAIDVELNGPEAIRKHLDPVTAVPFEMLVFPGGFELRSTWTAKPLPLTLTVGKKAK